MGPTGETAGEAGTLMGDGQVIAGGPDDPIIQVTGAVLLDDGIVIADGGASTVRFYEADGGRGTSIGTRGDGPGEFQRISWIGRALDRILVHDSDLQRLTAYDLAGDLVSTMRIVPPEGFVHMDTWGAFDDGTVLISALLPSSVSPQSESGVQRLELGLFRLYPDGEAADSIAAAEFEEGYVYIHDDGFVRGVALPLGRQTSLVTRRDQYFLTSNDHQGIDQFHNDGGLLDTFDASPTPIQRRFVTEVDIEVARERFLAQSLVESRPAELFEEIPLPDSFPYYGWGGSRSLRMMVVSAEGDLWVLNYGGIRNSEPTWTVFAPDGEVRAQVTSVDEVDILAVRDDRALVRVWDEYDVEAVELRTIIW